MPRPAARAAHVAHAPGARFLRVLRIPLRQGQGVRQGGVLTSICHLLNVLFFSFSAGLNQRKVYALGRPGFRTNPPTHQHV